MKAEKRITKKRARRAIKVRASVKKIGWPRLSVFRSNKYIYAEIIDDAKKETVASASSSLLKKEKKTKSEIAKEVGKEIAKNSLKKGIKKVVFDRGRYAYHGRVKALAEGAREEGLEF